MGVSNYPPYSWPGGSQIVDYDGRVLTEASTGPGERIVVGPIDISALRHERQTRVGHHMSSHLRTEAYEVYRRTGYSPLDGTGTVASVNENQRRIETAKKEFASRTNAIAMPSTTKN